MNFINCSRIRQNGFFTLYPAFQKNEFEYIQKSIDKQYIDVIKKEKIPNNILEKHLKDDFKVIKYHDISSYVNHSKIWPKEARILSKDFTNWFLKTSYMIKIKDKYGSVEITDEENIGYPNIYWRLVRPNVSRDVGFMHRDSWFWEIDKLNGKKFPSYKRLKTWLSIHVETGKNGLLVVPESHLKKNIEWEIIEKDGKKKPRLETIIEECKINLLETSNNTAVIFDDDLIHGGSINNGQFTRVSLEFTLFLKSNL